MNRRCLRAAPLAILVALGAVAPASAAPATEAVSVTHDGRVGPPRGRGSADAVLSANGRFVAFSSFKKDLVRHDTNKQQDVFVRDMKTGRTTRVSVSSAGRQADDTSNSPSISSDGRYVVFTSFAANLVKGAPDDQPCTPTATKFGCEGGGHTDVFLRDRKAHTTSILSRSTTGAYADADTYSGALSANGRFVAFTSEASNLSPDDNNTGRDVFIRNLKTRTTTLVSTNPGTGETLSGDDGAALSADGRYVAFDSNASNLVPGDTNDSYDVFVRDMHSDSFERASVGTKGEQGSDSIFAYALSPDGRRLAFATASPAYVTGDTGGASDILLRDLDAKTTRRLSVGPKGQQANNGSKEPVFSGDGRQLAFSSRASNLVSKDTNDRRDIFELDLANDVVRLVSRTGAGGQDNGNNSDPALSGDGRYVAYESTATNLVARDPHAKRKDVFRTGPLFQVPASAG